MIWLSVAHASSSARLISLAAVFGTFARLGTRTRGRLVLLAERERRFTTSDGADAGRVLASEHGCEVAVLGRTFATNEHKERRAKHSNKQFTDRKLHEQVLQTHAQSATCTDTLPCTQTLLATRSQARKTRRLWRSVCAGCNFTFLRIPVPVLTRSGTAEIVLRCISKAACAAISHESSSVVL